MHGCLRGGKSKRLRRPDAASHRSRILRAPAGQQFAEHTACRPRIQRRAARPPAVRNDAQQPMNRLRFIALPTAEVRRLQAGGLDANGQLPERRISEGDGVPCRHCLADVAAGEPYLVLSYRPFRSPQPYAECGPIFLHADPCERYADERSPPALFSRRRHLLVRGYDGNDRIVYGTGKQIAASRLSFAATELLQRPEVAYVHVRSAANNCYQCRIEGG
jgi:hypothetical protein